VRDGTNRFDTHRSDHAIEVASVSALAKFGGLVAWVIMRQ